ncbi:MAG: DUF4058 family protein [Planctomycetes bacterium]|nr:DUF4058 family protein [Planctomycetota bacterium]
MPSPFPGMDPYLEHTWPGVHARLIVYASDQLQVQLPSDLRADVEQRVLLEEMAGVEQAYRPDVYVVEHGQPRPHAPSAGGVAVAEPFVVHLDPDEVFQRYIDIVDAATGNQVITTIEFLSPTNKLPGAGQDKFRRKQEETLRSRVSIVEIDLVRAGSRVLMVRSDRIPPSHRTTYQVCSRRGWRPNDVEVYRAPLRERLPVIPIPLREADRDVTLDLQSLIDLAYRNGRYDSIDYSVDPTPPFDPPDAAWADALLREQRRR